MKFSAMNAKFLIFVVCALVAPALFVVAIGVVVYVLTWIRGAEVDYVAFMVGAVMAYVCMLVVAVKILKEYVD